MSSQHPTLLIDTNVWLDCYIPNRPGYDVSSLLLTTAFQYDCPLLYPATIVKDVFYLIANTFKRDARMQNGTLTSNEARAATEIAWGCVNSIREHATAVGADESDIWMACKLQSIHDDLEDNLIVAAAKRANATYLVTNDDNLIKHSPVATLTPSDALALLQSTFESTR